LDDNGNPVYDEFGISIEEPVYRFLNMTTTTARDCGEWTIFRFNTVLVTAKLMTRRQSSLVFYGDIADAIDGGEDTTSVQRAAAIVSCGTDGGSREVKASLEHEAYKPYRTLYENGDYISTDIVIKIVEDIEWKKAQEKD
jgi:hypothetical protein